MAHTFSGPLGRADRQQPGAGGNGLGEHQHPVVLGVDERLPGAAAIWLKREQLVGGARQRVDVDAVDARLARSNSVSSTHSADANVSLTPRLPEHDAEFISSTPEREPVSCARRDDGATPAARPAEELSLSRFGIDGVVGEVGSVTQARRG